MKLNSKNNEKAPVNSKYNHKHQPAYLQYFDVYISDDIKTNLFTHGL